MRRAALVVLAAVAVAGCGGESGDLMSFRISAGPTGTAKHSIVVTGDGRGSCDNGDEELLPSERVIDARELEAEAMDLARRAADFPAKAGSRRYTLSTDDGDVRWSEGTTGLPEALPKAQLLALQLERILCR